MLSTMPILLSAASLGFPIVEEGKPQAALAPLDAKAPAELRRAADEFQRVVEKMTATKLPVEARADGPIVHIGRDAFVDRAGLDLDTLDEDRARGLPGASLAGALLRLADQPDAQAALERLASAYSQRPEDELQGDDASLQRISIASPEDERGGLPARGPTLSPGKAGSR